MNTIRTSGNRRRVVFLDRDGTLIHDRPGFYLRRPEDMRLYPYTPKALKMLRDAGYRLVVLTNQSGIGRGFLNRATLARIHAKLRNQLRRHGASIDAIYFCPHNPEDGCNCRKPKTTLARRALKELGLNLKGAAMIGDKIDDINLARKLGITSVHIRTGHGRSQRARHGDNLQPTHTARNLLSAVRWLVKNKASLRAGQTI